MPIIINSKFRPFSFQEMLQPVAMAAQAHQALEDQYAELDTKASMWEKLKDSEIDRDVYQQYKAYSDALKSSSDELAQFGLTPSSRRAMLDMRARYSQDIAPIEQAWAERDRQMKVQQEMMLKDPTHMYRVNAGQVGLREYMKGNYDALTDNYSGALLTRQASEIATNLKAAFTDRSKLKSLGLPYQYERELQHGYTPEQVDAAIRGDANASPVLTRIIDQVLQSSGMSQWDNYDTIKDRVRGFIGQGIYSAIGTKKFENFKDDFSMQDALHARQFARQQAEKKQEEQQANEKPMLHWDGTIVSQDNLKDYNQTVSKLMHKSGRGLSREYVGNKFINPMKIYEEAMEYARKHPARKTNPSVSAIGASPTASAISAAGTDNTWKNAVDAMKRKYGVQAVIDSNDYERLSSLGYSSKSGFNEMAGTSIADRVNQLAQSYYATSTSMASYEKVGEKVLSTLEAWNNEDRFTGVYEYDNGKRGKPLKYKDILTGKGDRVEDVAYSSQNPDDIAVIINGKRAYINPAAHSAEAKQIVDYYKDMIQQSTTPKQKAYWQDRASDDLREVFNLYDPIRSTTSSKR